MVRFSGRALTVFVGGLGLGWVWKIPAFLCIVGGLGFTVHWLRGPVTLPFPMPPVFFLSAEAMALAIVLVATGIMARIDGCYLFSYGLDGRSIARKLIAGWIGGLAAISSLLGLLAFTGQMRIAGLSFPCMNRDSLAWVFYGRFCSWCRA